MSTVTPTSPAVPTTITNLNPAVTPLSGNEFSVIVQNGKTVRVASNQLILPGQVNSIVGSSFINSTQTAGVVTLGLQNQSNITVTATGATTARTLAAYFGDWLNVKDFGATGNGTTDDTAAIQACLTAAGAGNVITIPPGTYLLSSTLTAYSNQQIIGSGVNSTIFYRNSNYGDTILVTNALAFAVKNIWFQQGTSGAPPSVSNPAVTSGAHLNISGGQWTVIENCWFIRMKYNVIYQGSWGRFTDCQFQGFWDPLNTAAQEGVNNVELNGVVSTVFDRCEFLGATVTRSTTLTASDGSKTISNFVSTVGAQQGILILGAEDLTITNSYFGGMSASAIDMFQQSGKSMLDIRISDNMFDGLEGFAIINNTSVANLAALNVTISNNVFNGDFDGETAIYFNENPISSTPTVYNATITGNTFNAYYACPILLSGVCGFTVADNTITNYNAYNVSPGADPTFCSAIWISGVSAYGTVEGNTIGGGGNTFTQTTSNGNYCYQGIYINPSITTISIKDNMYAGVGLTTNTQVGHGVTENQYILTASGNYQMTGQDEVFICNKTVGGATAVNLPLYPPLGREAQVIDGKGDAATNNIIVGTGDSTAIHGSNSTTISTNYGFRKYRFNGVSWNEIS